MDTSGSFLRTVIERVHGYMDSDEVEKYTDDYIVRHVIGPSMVDVLARVNLNADNPIVLRFSITLVPGQQYYQLPCSIGEVWKIAILDTGGRVISEELPRGVHNPRGMNWAIEGNLLSIMPYPGNAQSFEVWYTSNGDYAPHHSTGGGSLDSELTTFTLGSPSTGSLDRRPGAYIGQILRLLPSAPGAIEERVISDHDPVGGTVTVRMPFTQLQYQGAWSGATAYAVNDVVTSGGSQYVCVSAHTNHIPPNTTYWRANTPYEIAPLGAEALYEAIAARASMKLGAFRNISQAKRQAIQFEYASALKSITDNLANMQMRTGKSFDRGSDNIARFRM